MAAKGIERFLDGEGRITQLPRKLKTRLEVLAYMASKFEPGVDYSQSEVNELCSRWHTFDDFFLLRRELVDNGLLSRVPDGSRYWREKKDEKTE